MFSYTLGSSVAFVQAQIQALEPFPNRAGSAAGLMGAVRSGMTAVVAATSGQLHDGTARKAAAAMCCLGLARVGLFLLIRPRPEAPDAGRATSTARDAGAETSFEMEAPRLREEDGAAAAASDDAVAELESAHAAAREEAQSESRAAKPKGHNP